MTRASNSSSRTVYHASPRRLVLFILIFAPFEIFLVTFGIWNRDEAALAVGIIFFFIMFFIIGICFWWFPRLVVTPEGIERHNIGYTLKTSWYNIAEFKGTKFFEGLVLRQPMTDRGATRFSVAATARFGVGAVPLYPSDVLDIIEEKKFFPLEVFAYRLKRGKLAEEIVRYAPWLAPQLDQAGSGEPATGMESPDNQ